VALHEPLHAEQVVGAMLVVTGLVLTRVGWRRGSAPAVDTAVQESERRHSRSRIA